MWDKLKGIQFRDSESVEQTCPEIARDKEILYINRSEIENMGYTQVDIMKLVCMAPISLPRRGGRNFLPTVVNIFISGIDKTLKGVIGYHYL